MSNNGDPYKQAINAYQDSNTSGMSGFDIVVELYKGMIKNIQQAKLAHREDKFDEMCNLIEKNNQILIALQSHIDRENGGEAAEFLDKFYTGIFGAMARVHKQEDPAEAFDALLGHIQPVYEIWCRHAADAAAAATGEVKQDDNGSGVEVGA